jgi:hypothetical protein
MLLKGFNYEGTRSQPSLRIKGKNEGEKKERKNSKRIKVGGR